MMKIAKRARLVVVDEAHKVLAPTYRASAETLTKEGAFLLGLTATPGRGVSTERENWRLAELFSSRRIAPTSLGDSPVEALQEKGVLARVDVERVSTGVTPNVSVESSDDIPDVPQALLNQLAKNGDRNALIIELVAREVKAERPSIIFACSVKHARELSLMAGIRGIRSAFVAATVRRSQRREIVRALKRGGLDAVFNYGVLSTGFDAPNIRTVLIARPTSSVVLYSQMIGRALRGEKVGGDSRCRLIDLRDNYELFGGVDEIYSFFDSYWD